MDTAMNFHYIIIIIIIVVVGKAWIMKSSFIHFMDVTLRGLVTGVDTDTGKHNVRDSVDTGKGKHNVRDSVGKGKHVRDS